ncbi:hypothetical protein Tco_1444017 [Tanacetum coccineum]
MNKFTALKTTTQHLERKTFTNCPLFQRAFSHLFHTDVRTFKYELSQNMNNLEKQLNNEILHENDSKSALSMIKIQECKIQEVKASDASLGEKDRSGIVSDKGNDQGLENQGNTSRDESSRSRNECNDKSTSGDDTDIRPSYDTEPMVEVLYIAEYNVFAVKTQHSEQPESINDTHVMEKDDSNVIPDSPNMCDNDNHADQNIEACDDEPVALANLIANLKLDINENKKIQKQLKKANASLTQELKECKSTLEETNRTLGESNNTQDICLIALQNKQTELEKYKDFNEHTIDYDILERKLNETLGLLSQKEIDIKEGLKLKAYEISVVKEKHDENQSIQTIHMLAPKGSTFNGRPTFANPMYLKKAQSEKPCLYEIPYDTSDLANRFVLDREETLTLEKESRSKLNKDLVKPYDYTKQNSLYEIFKPSS